MSVSKGFSYYNAYNAVWGIPFRIAAMSDEKRKNNNFIRDFSCLLSRSCIFILCVFCNTFPIPRRLSTRIFSDSRLCVCIFFNRRFLDFLTGSSFYSHFICLSLFLILFLCKTFNNPCWNGLLDHGTTLWLISFFLEIGKFIELNL